MHKWVYDRLVNEYTKKSKQELAQKIIALSEIECDDRVFANECYAGTTIYNINELFTAIEELQIEFSYEKAARVYELLQSAKASWNYIKQGLAEINNSCRCSKVLEDFKNKVNKIGRAHV